MKTFRQFIAEKWDTRRETDSQGGDRHMMASRNQIGKHRVSVVFSHNGGGNYNVDYVVNHRAMGHGHVGDDAHAILHHVHHTIDRFIRHRKPNGINMATTETKKHHLYRMFGKRLMKKHGGFMHSRDYHEGGLTMLKFPKKKS